VGWELRLHEKGGKHPSSPAITRWPGHCTPTSLPPAIAEERKGWLFRTAKGWKATVLADQPMNQGRCLAHGRQRAAAAGIKARSAAIRSGSPGLRRILENGGTLEHAQAMAVRESPRTTKTL
jgi:hypothetical protein